MIMSILFSTQQKCQPQYMKYYTILKFATKTKQFLLTCELAYIQNFKIKSTILLLRLPYGADMCLYASCLTPTTPPQ